MPSATTSSNTVNLAKTSLLFQVKEFFNNSTLHGVRYIAETGRPFFDKFLWWCCTSVGATVTLIIIVSLWEKFQTNPTITGLDTDFHNWDVEFPAISLCQITTSSDARIKQLIKKNYSSITKDKTKLTEYLTEIGGLNRYTQDYIKNYLNYPQFPQENLKEIAMEVVFRCEDIISNCTWKDEDFKCCEHFLPIFTENGFCYVFNIDPSQGVVSLDKSPIPEYKKKYIYETDPNWALIFTLKDAGENTVGIYIHSGIEQPGMDITPHHEFDGRIEKISFSVKTTYTTEDATQLSIAQRRCVFPKEIPLKTAEVYTYGACMRECRMKKSMEMCKCIPFYYKNIDGYPICNLTGISCIGENLKTIMTRSICSCQLGCENTVYEVEKLTEGHGKEGPLEIAFVSWPMIRYKREVLFGWVDLLVSFGGIAGLFLGFSLLSGVEIIYYFTMRACCMLVREKETLEDLKRKYELEEKPPLDLSMTPSFMKKKESSAARIQQVQSYY